jgi:hypothetical protein
MAHRKNFALITRWGLVKLDATRSEAITLLHRCVPVLTLGLGSGIGVGVGVMNINRSCFARCFAAMATIFSAWPATGQTCAALAPAGQAFGYQHRVNSPRCEGFIQIPSAGVAGISLVSLTYGAVEFDLSRDSELRLSLPEPPERSVLIRGEYVPVDRYYRLDAELSPTRPVLRLGLGDVIAPAKIRPDDLGLYAYRLLPGGHQELIPLLVGSERSPTATAGGTIRVILRPGIDVTNVAWRIRFGDTEPEYRPVPLGQAFVLRGTKLVLDIPRPAASRAFLDLRFSTRAFDGTNKQVSDTIRLSMR